MVAVADIDHHDEAAGTFQLSGQRKDTSLSGKIINVYRANFLTVTERISKFHITLKPKIHHSHHKSLQYSHLYLRNILLSNHS